MNEQTLVLIASGIAALVLLIVVWKRNDPVKTKLKFSALLLVPVFGPIFYIIILGLSEAPPQEEHFQNRGSHGDHTHSWISMKPYYEKGVEQHRRALDKASNTSSDADVRDSVDVSFKPAQGWILVSKGSPSAIKSAIVQYDNLYIAERPGTFRVQLHPQSDGSVAVLLPDGLPAYDLVNMTGWLNAPPDHSDVSGAVVWMRAPAEGARYYLEAEAENPHGDTLIGASSTGQSVRVHVPETGLLEDLAERSYRKEQKIETSPNPTTINVVLETSTAFGNPDFELCSLDHEQELS